MGRIREMLDVDGRDSWTLFDTGARNTYIVPAVASVLTVRKARHPYRTALGGGLKVANEVAILEAELEGRPIPPMPWCWTISVGMKREKRSKSSSARWRCGNGALGSCRRKRSSIWSIIQGNSWSGDWFHYRNKLPQKVPRATCERTTGNKDTY
uniref:Aspartyl protease n=1 Tax=Candidatus Kentrum sp. TC TaxID=2126339 RepID=A0A450YXD2_9GAMM|nr:MAG: hypothetical protein BECKTC1821D_GA0114238_10288 [Candidatus Kentron sp. TC]